MTVLWRTNSCRRAIRCSRWRRHTKNSWFDTAGRHRHRFSVEDVQLRPNSVLYGAGIERGDAAAEHSGGARVTVKTTECVPVPAEFLTREMKRVVTTSG